MRLLTLCFLLLISYLARAQTTATNWWLDAQIGYAFNEDGRLGNTPLLTAGLNRTVSLSPRLELVLGAGLEHRSQNAVTQDGTPCVFPLGFKVVQFTDEERISSRSTLALGRVGLRYAVNRFRLGVAALPAYRLGGDLEYRFRRLFTTNRPDAVLEQRLSPGETLDATSIGGGGRAYTYDRFQLRAELSVDYLLSDRLSVGLSVRPSVGRNALYVEERSFCNDEICVDVLENRAELVSLRSTDVVLRAGFGF